jgi:uncharacterized membrane protein YecN with MAPEG domain
MTTPITIVSFTILFLLYQILAVNVIMYRRNNKISLGDSSDNILLRKIRMHGNFAEYAPFGIFTIFLLEYNSVGFTPTILVASAFILSRFLHPYSLSTHNKLGALRPVSMALTFTSITVGLVMLVFSLFTSIPS